MIHCVWKYIFFYNKNTSGSWITYYGRDKFYTQGNGQLMRFIVDSYVAFLY